jgi:ATP-dependent exoDNAse (exonuclease V) beta subunit
METLAVELDVKNIMERWDMSIEECMTDVKALIAAAKQYEERSSELAQPATPSGFAAFLGENDVKLPITGKGVQLLTYHGAKGLEWKYVFVLMDESLDQASILSRDFYGIHHFHPELPSAENLYPKMSIRLLPWIFGTKKNVPESIADQLFPTEEYATLEKHCKEESARLLYVGMTRAAEVMVIVPWFKNKELDWLVQSGLANAGNVDGGDVLGIGVPFEIVKAQFPAEEEDIPSAPEPKQFRKLDYHSDTPSNAEWLTIAPSGVKGKSDEVDVVYRSEEFIKINSGKLHGRNYSEVGDCIHNVFAAIEHLDKQEVEQLIRSHGMDDVLPNVDEVIRAWDNLQGFLKKEFGEPVAVYHERPFRQLQENGTVVIGSIDYVYRTSEGAILIDFKTFPQIEAVTDSTSLHFAGYYAGQLNAYATALEANGEKVLKRFIYYPVSGMVVEIGY